MSAQILCFAFGASLTSSISLLRMPHMGCWTRRSTRLPTRSLCIFVDPHHRNGFQVPEGHDAVGRIQQYSTLASGTPSSIDDSCGRQATGSSAIHAMVGYRGSASTFVRANCRHICHAPIFELGNLSAAPRSVEPDGEHCSWFGHSLYYGCYVDQRDRSHHDHSARWLDRHQRCHHAHPRLRLVGTRSVQRAFRH